MHAGLTAVVCVRRPGIGASPLRRFYWYGTGYGIVLLFVLCVFSPWLLIPSALALGGVYMLLRRMRRRRSREQHSVKVYSNFVQVLSGLVTIRAYGVTDDFVAAHHDSFDRHIREIGSEQKDSGWISVVASSMGSLMLLALALAIAADNGISLEGATFIVINGTFASILVRLFTTHQVGLERLGVQRAYLDDMGAGMPQEDTAEGTAAITCGAVEFQGVDVCYQPGVRVVSALHLAIPAGQRVGIVGRTGAGKSTLVRVLTRLTRPAKGTVLLDGQDVGGLALRSLRRQVAVLSQQPHLFGGTVRFNLDPTGARSDAELWSALAKARVKDLVASQLGGLEGKVASRGGNISAGQGQLLCLARVLLSDCKLILLDEATAALDADLCQLVEAVLREQAAGATVINVAHRLAAVANVDRVIVMDGGRLVEDGPRTSLLEREGSEFSRLSQHEEQAKAYARRPAARSDAADGFRRYSTSLV